MKRSAEKTGDETKDAKRHAAEGDSSSTSPPPASNATTPGASGASPAAALAPAQPPLDVSQHQQVMKFVVPNDKAGAVIGRGGESISKTRQISGAVVKIDKSEFGADRTVTLQGTSVQIQAAYSDIMLNLQKAGVTDPSHMTPTPRADNETTLQVLVPVGKVGGLIGKQGSSISEIRSTSGCFVKVASVQDTPPGATDRVVTLRGSPMAIQLAQQLIINKLATVEDRGGGGGGGGGQSWGQPQQQYGNGNPGAYAWTHEHAQMGLQPSMPLPGAGGQNHFGVDAATLAWYNQQAGMGGMPGGMGGMQQQGMGGMQQQQQGMGGQGGQGGQTQIKMSVSGDVAGRIIGRGGASINEIRRTSGARVEVGPRGDSQHSMREITITGSAYQNQTAQYLIGLKMVEAGASSGGSGHNA